MNFAIYLTVILCGITVKTYVSAGVVTNYEPKQITTNYESRQNGGKFKVSRFFSVLAIGYLTSARF